ncbi:hypothetical protein GPROT2_01080 [Gammaproteobacteria bacterium]|nr:porin family protein [Gammaproteobacteria bacterium]QOJ30777.1 MAG: porin family protein [Gammaproteobacteria bacterium]CAG0940779.1 hypothetical protein GPROT2_01080 [Gammaproteobacteria bacterium]
MHDSMLKTAVMTSLLMACGSPAGAAGFFLTGGLTGTNIETDGLPEAIAAEGLWASGEVKDTAVGYQIGIGYDFNEAFAVEFKYGDSGDGEETIIISDGIDSVPVNIKSSIDGFTLYGVAQGSFAPDWFVYGKAGYTFQDGEVDISAFGASESVSDDDDGLALAAGVRHQVNANWSISGELEYFSVDFDSSFKEPLRGSINLIYHFSR